MAKAQKLIIATISAMWILLWIIFSKSLYSLLTLSAIILHETGHILAALIYQNGFKGLILQSGGLRLNGNLAYSSYSSEALIAFAGPFFNLISALAFTSAVDGCAVYFRQVSVALALLNLLPIRDFDGGRILHSISAAIFFPERCEKICDIFSFFALFFIWSISVYVLLKTGKNISSFLFSAIIFFKITKDHYEYDFKRLSKNN